jgi:hypothetical protein
MATNFAGGFFIDAQGVVRGPKGWWQCPWCSFFNKPFRWRCCECRHVWLMGWFRALLCGKRKRRRP